MVAKKREQGDEPGQGGIYALQSLEQRLEPRGPPLVDTIPPQRHHGGIPERGYRMHGKPFS